MQNKNTTIIIILLVIIAAILAYMALKKPKAETTYQIPTGDTAYEKDTETSSTDTSTPSGTTTYTYKNHGFTMELPNGLVPKEYQGETGPTYSMELPGGGWFIYITDATWWERYNITGQTDYLGDIKIGTTTFKRYRYTGQIPEFYYYRQGNVAYMFSGNNIAQHMETFKFVGWN